MANIYDLTPQLLDSILDDLDFASDKDYTVAALTKVWETVEQSGFRQAILEWCMMHQCNPSVIKGQWFLAFLVGFRARATLGEMNYLREIIEK